MEDRSSERKSAERRLEEQHAKQDISQQYLNPENNPELDPERQEQIDRNRIPAREQATNPEEQTREDAQLQEGFHEKKKR